jgi:putative intracellular protease/amidase
MEASMKLSGKTVGILAANGFEDLEFWVPYMRVREEGAAVIVIGIHANETYTSKSGGLSVSSEAAADGISAEQLDGLLVPGGWAPDKLRRNAGILQLVRDMHARKKILGFICHAGWVAASRDMPGHCGYRQYRHQGRHAKCRCRLERQTGFSRRQPGVGPGGGGYPAILPRADQRPSGRPGKIFLTLSAPLWPMVDGSVGR